MRYLILPEIFFKSVADKGKLYSRLWFYWLSSFVDELLEPEFLEKQIQLGKKIKDFPNDSEIKEVYEFGLQLLQQHNFKIQDADADVIESPKKKKEGR